MSTKIEKDGIVYEPNKKYYVAGARSAWDTVPVGLFNSWESCRNAFPTTEDSSFVREATQLEINNFFNLPQ